MTPHDCATQGHRFTKWNLYGAAVCLDCGRTATFTPTLNPESETAKGLVAWFQPWTPAYEAALDALLRRALTDAVQVGAVYAAERIKNAAIREGGFGPTTQADALNAMRDILITAILTAARETGR